LIASAKLGMQNAYAVVSGFPVGAAVLTATGRVFQGCNTESVISGMGVCAERSAIDHAVACGEYLYQAIAVTSKLEKPIAPCGMCLQYIGEFSQVADCDIEILMVGATGEIRESSIREMLPAIFGPLDLGLDLSRYRK
jgi:cytidine deaminase